MFFTREDILKIQNALLQLSVKDSELPSAEPVTYDDTLSIVQDGKNKQIKIEDFFNQISLWKREDFINITDKYDEHYISLIEAINLVPILQRKDGLVITFQDIEGNWEIYQFRGNITEFFNVEKWFNLYDYRNNIIQSIVPDEEDLTVSTSDENGNSLVSLKDRVYDPTSFSGKGYKILRKNIQTVDGKIKNILTQDMINKSNTIYEIRYDFDLNQNIINIPSNCVLCFKGGSFINGSLYGTDTELINFHNVLNVELLGSFTNNGFHVSNYFKLVEKYNCILSASLLYISKYDSFLDDCMKFQNMLGIDYYHICLNIDVNSSSNPTKIIYATKCEYDKVTTLEEIINILNVSIPLCKHGIFEGFKIHTENSRIDELLTNVTNGKSKILEFFDLYMNDLEKFRNLNCRNEVTFFAFMNEENQLFDIEDNDIIDKLKQVIQKIKSIFPKAQITYSASHYIEYSSIIQYMNYPSLNLYLYDLSYKGIDTKVTDVINNYSTIKRQIEHTLSNLVNFRLTEFGALNNEHGLTDGASFENRGKELEPFYVPYLHCLALFANINISRFIGFSIWYFDSYYIKNDILYTYWGDETVSNGYLTDIISIFKFTFYENI